MSVTYTTNNTTVTVSGDEPLSENLQAALTELMPAIDELQELLAQVDEEENDETP